MVVKPIKLITHSLTPSSSSCYSVVDGAYSVLDKFVSVCRSELPPEFDQHIEHVNFSVQCVSSDTICLPCPLKEQETGSALKALEGCAAAAVADLRFGKQQRSVNVDVGRVTCFFMSAYITTLDGMSKIDPKIKLRIPGWFSSPPFLNRVPPCLIPSHRYRSQPGTIHTL
jgi:hypothetical protein